MNPERLHFADGKPANVWFCTSCRLVSRDQKAAQECCTCPGCGGKIKRPSYLCADCHTKQVQEQDAKRAAAAAALTERRVAKAAPLEDSDEYVFRDDKDDEASFGEREDMIGEAEEEDAPGTRIVFWAAKPLYPHKIDARDIADQATEGLHESAVENVVGLDELQAALDAWFEKQPPVSYEPDYRRCLVYVVKGENRE